jgi:hypothetical protein
MARPVTPIGDFDTDYEDQQRSRELGVADKVNPPKAAADDTMPELFEPGEEEPDEGRDFAGRKKKGGMTFARSRHDWGNTDGACRSIRS